MTALPEWLRTGADPEGAPPRRPPPHRLLRRTLAALGRSLALLVPAFEGTDSGPLRAADPRAKLIAAVGLIVVATSLRGAVPLAACIAITVGLAAGAKVAPRRLLPALVAVPLASAALMLPATLNLVSAGAPLLVLWRPAGGGLGPWRLPEVVAVTSEGLLVAGRMVLRTTACAALALLLAATTRPQRLLGGLRSLGVPQAFVLVLAMAERYLAVLLRSAQELHLARLARSVAPLGVRREEAWAAAGMGAMFRRTRSLADAVTLAMISRGFSGEVRLLRPTRWRGRDWLLVGAAAAVAAALLVLDRRPA